MVLTKTLFAVHLKHSGLWPSADFKLISNDLVHAMLTVQVCSLSVGEFYGLWGLKIALKMCTGFVLNFKDPVLQRPSLLRLSSSYKCNKLYAIGS